MLKTIHSFILPKYLLVLGGLFLLSVSCSKEEAKTIPVIQSGANVTKTLKEKAMFPIGAAVTVAHLKETDFSTTFKNNYNQLTAEYEMKMSNIWTSASSYSFSNTDYLVDYARQNYMKVHGHGGVSDKYTWLTGWWHPLEYPLLFDKTYAKKKAYEGFLSGLK